MNTNTKTPLLPTIEINPTQPATATLIWLHGLGAHNDDFVPVAATLQQLTGLPLRFVFPQAPQRAVTINNGVRMPAWYDITSFDKGGKLDQEGISISVAQIKTLIQAEKEKGFKAQQIFLAGFSQGAVIALATLLSSTEELGGIIALSGYLHIQKQLPDTKHLTPIFIGHGLEDEMVPCIYGETASAALQKAGYPVDWHTYPMAHSVCDQEIRELAEWLSAYCHR